MENEQAKKSGGFNTRMGLILAAAGSAIGLGNIWKFPYIMGSNGGSTFFVLYLACVVLFGLPLMLTEFIIGKKSGKSAFGAFRAICGNNRWQWLSWLCMVTIIIFIGFYFVVTGWCVSYLYEAVMGSYIGKESEALLEHFTLVTSDAPRMILFTVLPILATAAVLWFDVNKGIERISKVLMPLLFVLMIVMIARVLTLDGSSEGLHYMFDFDPSQLTPRTLMMAVGQCFLSLSLGCGMMIIFGAYMPTEQDATSTSITVIVLDTLVAVLAGLIIFPAVFAFGFSPSEGPQLVFAVLPEVFQKMSCTWLSGVAFFLLLFVAALSSTIAMMETLVANLREASDNKLNRHQAVLIAAALSVVLASACVISMSDLGADLRVFGHNLFEASDLLVTTILLPVGALGMSLYLGWVLPKRYTDVVPVSRKRWKRSLRPAFIFSLRWIVPATILLILLNGFGLFDKLLNPQDCQEPQASKGHLDTYVAFPSQHVPARTIRVWTPANYSADMRYDVLYMHDGQMLYDATTAWNHQEWGVDEAMDSLISQGAIRPTIVVGIDNNNDNRIGEYCPDDLSELYLHGQPVYKKWKAQGNAYLTFLVTELKPFIDSVYSTYTDRDHTWVMGSSCGGLISSYALCKYPEVFAGAACMSTHCTLAYPNPAHPNQDVVAAYRDYLRTHLTPNSCLLYMDRGDKTLDAFYDDAQAAINEMFETEGWDESHFEYRFFPGHAHCEDDWRARLDLPLRFMLGNKTE